MNTQLRARDRGQAGFTLVELMATVIVLGILVTVATASFKTSTVGNDARAVAAFCIDARREAMSRGPLRADVQAVAALNGDRVRLELDQTGDKAMLRLYVVVEGPGAGDYDLVLVGEQALGSGTVVFAVSDAAATEPGGTIDADWELDDGTVARGWKSTGQADAMTVYLGSRSASGDESKQYRVVVLPLLAQANVYAGW